MAEKTMGLDEGSDRYRKKASLISLIVGIALLLLKFWAYNLTRSQAVFSDALESIVNVVAASLALFVVFYATKPADSDHPYGHGKVEYFSAAFEGGLITFAAVFIVVEAVRAYIAGHRLYHLDQGLPLVAFAGVANLLLGLYLIRTGKSNQSVALKASGHHLLSDFWTSFGVALGLLFMFITGQTWIDSLIALAVGGYLAFTGIRLVRESIGGLMDEEDPELLRDLAKIMESHLTYGIIQVHHVRVIRSGWYHHIDAHVVVPEYWTVSDIHDRVLAFETAVINNYQFDGEMNFHVDPCRRAYCRVCSVKDCPIRVEKFEERLSILLEDLRSLEEPDEYRD